jgi:hypothetical protein
MNHNIAINKPGALYTVTGRPNIVKFIGTNNIVKAGPRARPICRQARK